MADIYIFVDDFNVEVRPGSWSQYGTSYGFAAALVPKDGLTVIEAILGREIAKARADGVLVDELHGMDLVGGEHGWSGRRIVERVRVIKRVLEAAKRTNVHFLWELVQDGRLEFSEVRMRVFDALRDRLPESVWRRFSLSKNPRLPISIVLRRAAMLYAFKRLGAKNVVLVQDRNIPQERNLDASFCRELSDIGCHVFIQPPADSRTVLGLQLADLAARTLSLASKLSRRIDTLKESGTYPGGDPFDAFTQLLIQEDVLPLLDSRVRTHRAVDLDL